MGNFEIQRCMLVRESVASYDAESFTVACSDEVADIGRRLGLDTAAEEIFAILCVNAKGRIIAFHEVSHGDVTSSTAHPREVFKRALLNNATSLIMMHSHPSGNPAPSDADITATKRLVKAGNLLGVPVIDHIILGEDTYTSMKAQGLM